MAKTPPGGRPLYNYDHTSKERQARRRALHMKMKDALTRIDDAETLAEAKAIAREGLREETGEENTI